MEILIVVDMQNDFIDGALGTEEAKNIVLNVIEKIKGFQGKVFFTKDTHEETYLSTLEGKNLPVKHCILGTFGWEFPEEIACLVKEEPIHKPTFGSKDLMEQLKKADQEEPIERIVLVGLCTDICVISNAMLCKAFFPEVPILVDASCCAGVTPESHKRALEAMKVCQIEILE